MKGGDEFKALGELLTPDRSSAHFVTPDAESPSGFRLRELADTYAFMADLALPEAIPGTVRGYFDAARMMWVYGWYYYPFYTWSALHAMTCVEMGLRVRYRSESDNPSSRASFADMLQKAVKRQWLTIDGFSRFNDIRENRPDLGTPDLAQMLDQYLMSFRRIRNWHAHPDQFSYMIPSHGAATIRFARETLLQLFPVDDRMDR